MKLQIYQILHVLSMALLVAYTFGALANPVPKNKRQTMIATGILTLTMLVGGFGLLAVMKYGWELWVFVKIACWVGLAAIPALAFRKPGLAPIFRLVATALIVIAIVAVYTKFGAGAAVGSGLE